MPNKSDVDLGYAASLEPKLAVDYFRAKGFKITHDWREMSAQAHAQAFTVAKAARMDILETIRVGVDDALAHGLTSKQFIKTLEPALKKAGWWGEQVIVDSDGNAQKVKLGSARRLETIYLTNLATAYQAGRYQQQLATSDTHPYWQYIAVLDENTRSEHRAMHGRVFRFDDPIWLKLYPPNGWGCRCRIRALTAAQVKRMGLKIESSVGNLHSVDVEMGVDERTGEIYTGQSAVYRTSTGKMKVSPEWSHSPGDVAMGSDVVIARKLIELESRELRQTVIQSLNNSTARKVAYDDWVGRVLTLRRAGHSIQPLGFMSDELAEIIEEKTGLQPARLFALSEKNLIHADSEKHKKAGLALTLTEYQELPSVLQNPDAVIYDTQNKNILFISNSKEVKNKIVINSPYKIRRNQNELDVVINAYKVDDKTIQKAIAGGNYILLYGDG